MSFENHEIIAEPGNVQSKLNEIGKRVRTGRDTSSRFAGNYNRVTLDPSKDYNSGNMDLPIVLRGGVVLDMAGNTIEVNQDTDVFHHTVMSHLWNGTVDYRGAGQGYSSRVFDFDTTKNNQSDKRWNLRGVSRFHMRNVNSVGAEGNSGTVFFLDASDRVIARSVFHGGTYRNVGKRWIRAQNLDTGNWLNGNTWHRINVTGGKIQMDLEAGITVEGESLTESRKPVFGNHWDISFQANQNTDWLYNSVGGSVGSSQINIFDFNPENYNEGIVKLESKSDGGNTGQLFLDHTNTNHRQQNYNHNQGFWNDNTPNANGWKLKDSDPGELLYGKYRSGAAARQ